MPTFRELRQRGHSYRNFEPHEVMEVSYHGLKAVTFPHDGFPATDLRQTEADCTTPVLPERTVWFARAYSHRALSGEDRWRVTSL